MHVSPAFETLSACLSLASGGDEEKVCFYLKVLHSWRACKRCSCRAVSCMYVCLLVLICVRARFCLLHGLCVCLIACVFMCLHVCICTLLCVSAFAWRSLYRPEQNSLVKRAAINATLGEERRREEERVRGNDKWLGHTSRN